MSDFKHVTDLRGIACMCAGVFCLTLSDGIAKWFGGAYAPIQLIFLRGVISVPAIVCIALIMGKRSSLHTPQINLHLFRGLLGVLAACSYYIGITLLPFADVTAIGYASPLFVAAISVTFFKEKVDVKTWLAILIGFMGVLVFARPGGNGIGFAVIFPLATALGYAIMMISARNMDSREDIITSMFYLALAQFVFSTIVILWFWQPINQVEHWIGFAGMAFLSSLGLGLITQAFRIAPAAVVAPYDYTAIIWAIALGWLFWDENPDFWSYAGILIIAISGIYVIVTRAQLAKRKRAHQVP